ncbi:hypothetical protein [Priestia aryabhattai]|uniref:O-antigen ligase family protein n=1 Tax=Priestia aryabhattai TaxID=412384 RepID=UPI002E1A2D5E|nr:hypothetical protein [Priestia aryabhattai]MED4261167.1 hypothetical protein [Priestia aryabhattai]
MKKKSLLSKTLVLCLILIAFRPLIDLSGSYEGSGINLGGMYGIFFSILLILKVLLRLYFKKNTYLFEVFFVVIMIIYLLGILHSTVNSSFIVSSSRFIVGFSAIFLLYFYQEVKLETLKKIFVVLLLTSSVPIVIAWLQYLGMYPYTYFDYAEGNIIVGRASGGYLQPNSLTRILLFVVLLIYISGNNLVAKIPLKYSIIFLCFMTIVISGHRTSLVIFVVFFISYEFIFSRNMVKFLFKSYILIPTIIIFLLIIMSDQASPLINYVNVYYATFADLLSGNSNLRGREDIWGHVMVYLQSNDLSKWLVGIGYPPFEAHNDFLRVILVNGLIGLIIQSLFFIYIYIFVRKRVSSIGKKSLNMIYIYLFIFSMTLQPTEYPYFMWLFSLSLLWVLVYQPALRQSSSIEYSALKRDSIQRKEAFK